jgi:hypothetical protein
LWSHQSIYNLPRETEEKMTPEDRSKIQSFISDADGLKSRSPEESKFKDWKEKVEKKGKKPAAESAEK